MSKITEKTSLQDLAFIVSEHLKTLEISTVLVGGAVVSIYSDNEYESNDLDFISPNLQKEISNAMKQIGFYSKGRSFYHNKSKFSVEFPTGPLAIGDQVPIKAEGRLTDGEHTLKLFSPTQSVMDRLS